MAFFGFGKKEKDKMKTGLEKTRTGFWGSIMNTLTGSVIDDEMYDDLEEQLILADVGGEVAVHLVDKLRDRVRDKGLKTGEQAADALRDIIAEEMTPEAEMALDGKPASFWSSASTAWARLPALQSWLITTPGRASGSCWLPATPSVLLPASSWRSGQAAPVCPSSARARAQTPPPSSLIRSSLLPHAAMIWSLRTPQAVCTTNQT